MGKCNELLGKGSVVWPCLLDRGHDGPHMAHEYAPSVAARRAWENKHPVTASAQQTLWEEPEPLTDRERRHIAARNALDDLQGQPQTFWQRNGMGDEYPMPEPASAPVVSVVAPVAVEVAEAAATHSDPLMAAEGTEVAAFMSNNVLASMSIASRAFAEGDVEMGLHMVSLARASMDAIPHVIGES